MPPARSAPSDRVARAHQLARDSAEGAAILLFYADLVVAQQALLDSHRTNVITPSARPSVRDAVDAGAVAALVPAMLSWLQQRGNPQLSAAAARLSDVDASVWPGLFESYWSSDAREETGIDEVRQFVVEATLQPFAEAAAVRVPQDDPAAGDAAPPGRFARCPACSGLPVVASLRERGHGARRGLVCGLCLFEWPTLRLVCPSCGEDDFDTLPVFRADELRGIRIDACETCRTYIKTIDLSENGVAIPVVDDLASLAMDAWAQEQGYRKPRPNLLRL